MLALIAALGVIGARVVAERLALEVRAAQAALEAAEVRHNDLLWRLSTVNAPWHVRAVAAAHGFIEPTWEELVSGQGAPTPVSSLGTTPGGQGPLPAGTVARG